MDNMLLPEKAVLLGLIPLLGATADSYTASGALFTAAAVSLLVYALNLAAKKTTIPYSAKWALLAAAGFSAGWVLSGLIPFVLPVPDSSVFYFRLIGVSPVVYFAAGDNVSFSDAVQVNLIFLALLPVTGLIREILGNGTVFGYLVSSDFTIYSGIFAEPAGAFFIIGLYVVSARRVCRKKEVSGESGS